MKLDLDTIRREAREARELTYAWSDGRLDLVTVCREHGITVRVVALESDVDGVLACQGSRWLMIINRRTNRTAGRRRFTMAHELGHFRLHRERQQLFMCSRLDRSRMEWEANRFAVELLLPEDFIRWLVTQEADVAGISRQCGVSVAAVRRRLQEIEPARGEHRCARMAI